MLPSYCTRLKVKQDGCYRGEGGDEREGIPDLISLFLQQVKVNCQTERNAEIKYDKDTAK